MSSKLLAFISLLLIAMLSIATFSKSETNDDLFMIEAKYTMELAREIFIHQPGISAHEASEKAYKYYHHKHEFVGRIK